MKKISVLFTFFCFLLVNINIYGQDSENNWQFSFGVNAVDLDADSSTKPADFFDVQDNWNVSKSPISMISLSKYCGNNISFGLSGSFNTISKYTSSQPSENATNEFLAIDAMFKYDLSDVFTVGNLEPFVGIGPGYTWFEDQKYLTGNLSLGMNYWFSEVFGITFMADFKNNYDDIRDSLRYDEGGTMRWSAMLSMKF